MLNVSIKSIFNSGGGNELVKKKGEKKDICFQNA